jgi:hypothetical protein
MHVYVYAYAKLHMHACMRTHTYIHTQKNSLTIYTYTHICIHARVCVHTHNTHVCAYTLTHAHIQFPSLSKSALFLSHTHTYIHTQNNHSLSESALHTIFDQTSHARRSARRSILEHTNEVTTTLCCLFALYAPGTCTKAALVPLSGCLTSAPVWRCASTERLPRTEFVCMNTLPPVTWGLATYSCMNVHVCVCVCVWMYTGFLGRNLCA